MICFIEELEFLISKVKWNGVGEGGRERKDKDACQTDMLWSSEWT